MLETQAEHFLKVLENGSVSTNIYLRRIHNFALDMSWLPWPVLPKKRWPAIKFKEKRGITLKEHQAIVEREQNVERKAFYKLAWHLGASQSDIAFLEAENIDLEKKVISFARMKTGSVAVMRFDDEVAEILRDLPGTGPLFPYLRTVRAGDRSTEFHQRCVGLGQNNKPQCAHGYHCPQVLEMIGGDFAVVGADITDEAIPAMLPGLGVGPRERIVRIPRQVFIAACEEIPSA